MFLKQEVLGSSPADEANGDGYPKSAAHTFVSLHNSAPRKYTTFLGEQEGFRYIPDTPSEAHRK